MYYIDGTRYDQVDGTGMGLAPNNAAFLACFFDMITECWMMTACKMLVESNDDRTCDIISIRTPPMVASLWSYPLLFTAGKPT